MAGKSKKQQTIAGMNDDKNEALKHALKAMEDQFGPGTIMRLGDQTKLEVETIPTGSIALDRALGVGGLPKGRIIEIYGPESSGKTTVALHCVAEAQKRGGCRGGVDRNAGIQHHGRQRLRRQEQRGREVVPCN